MEGRVTGLAGGALVGWVTAAKDGGDIYLEGLALDLGPFGRVRAEPGEDGRLHFTIPLPQALRDGRMHFLDVRPMGGEHPLEGGPVIWDGGLLAPASDLEERLGPAEPAPVPVLVEGQVRFSPPSLVEGWAFAPDEPERRLRLEVLAGEHLLTAITADQAGPADAGEAARGHGFRIDLARLLRWGPHEVTIRVEGFTEPLPQGRLRAGPFARDGEVDCPSYLDDDDSRALIGRLPFEHLAFEARRIAPARLAPRLINRLRRERTAPAAVGPPSLLILLGDGADEAARVWALQSDLTVATAAAADGADAIRAAAAGAGHVFFARPQDLLHPSAASIVRRLGDPDAVMWGRFCADAPRAGAGGTVLRRPPFDPVTARHGAITDTTLALKGEVLARAPDEVLGALAVGRLHPLWFWLAGQGLDWRLHPEALTSSLGQPPGPSRAEIEADEAFYRERLASEGGAFTLERTSADLPFPFVLVPARRAGKLSVLIPFRGRPAMTLRCIHSLARQRLSGELELVLVDNQSPPDEAQAVLDGARRLLGEARVVSLTYDAPFNHSAQNNLAARAATGEALVLCNNDVVLSDPDLIEQLAAWSLQPGMASVGCRLLDPERAVGSYGQVLAPPSADPFQPPLRENDDGAFGAHVHACPGNTLALAAMARERFLDLGGLDEARFPVGYNDLDLMLRASGRGLMHLYLGHLSAQHARGSSRTGDNEDLQALWLNQQHAAAPADRLAQLGGVRIDAERPPPSPASARGTSRPVEDEELARLQAEIQARRAHELKREDVAKTLGRAAELVRRLGAELGKD
jgi:GT2 family glycosyltransferase